MKEEVKKQIEDNFDEFIRENYYALEPDVSFDEISGKISSIRKVRKSKFYLRVVAAILFLTVFAVSFFSFYRRHAYIKKIDESYAKVMSGVNGKINPFDGENLLEGLNSSNPFVVKNHSFRELKK